MKVRYKECVVGLDFIIKPREVRDVSSEEGKRLCESGICVPVASSRAKASKPKVAEKR